MAKPAKSKGHVAFVRTQAHGDYEYYVQAGEVYRASVSNAMDLDGYRMGRWEGPERQLSTIIKQQVDAAKKFGGSVEIDPKYKKLQESEMPMLNELLSGLRGEGSVTEATMTKFGEALKKVKSKFGSEPEFLQIAKAAYVSSTDDAFAEVPAKAASWFSKRKADLGAMGMGLDAQLKRLTQKPWMGPTEYMELWAAMQKLDQAVFAAREAMSEMATLIQRHGRPLVKR